MRPTVPLLLLPFAWLAAPAADACSCPSPSLDVAIANADAIFVGEVVAIDSHLDVPNATCVNAPPFERITYAVQQVHKGCVEAEVHVLNNLDCGLNDAVGDIVAVFAGLGSDGNYRSGACSGSATPATLVGVLGDPAPPSDVTCPSRCLADGGISPPGPNDDDAEVASDAEEDAGTDVDDADVDDAEMLCSHTTTSSVTPWAWLFLPLLLAWRRR